MSSSRSRSETSRILHGHGPHVPTASPAYRAASHPSPIVQLAAVGLSKRYRKAQVEIPVLRGVDLEVHQGEFLSIIGQ